MGTRAQFFLGNPQDLESRKWLGCVAWDGHAEGDCGEALNVTSEEAFIEGVRKIAKERDDFCDPAKNGFPFPWDDDLFRTDVTFAWFDGQSQVTNFHRGFVPLARYLADEAFREESSEGADTLPSNVAAPSRWDRTAPDSIIIVSAA